VFSPQCRVGKVTYCSGYLHKVVPTCLGFNSQLQ
jgi:hypothetical protein